MTPETIANALGRATLKTTGGYMAQCPCHPDDKASLSIDTGEKGLLVKCFAGCTQADIINSLKSKGLWPESPPKEKKKRTVVVQYNYGPHYKTRFDDKTFCFSHQKDGKLIYSRNGDPLPYRLKEIQQADGFCVVEGEKDADNLSAIGIPATTLDAGADSPVALKLIEAATGKEIVLIPDNDPPGRKYADRIGAALLPVAASVKILLLPGLAEKQDVSDWLNIPVNGKEQLLELLRDAPEWTTTSTVIGGPSTTTGTPCFDLPEPLPLLRTTDKNDPFPIEALPPIIQAAAARVREIVQAPLDLVCQSFLAAATLATQPHVDVLIDGRRFPVSNNFIALGVSGERKSAVDRIATGPIKERQHEQAQAYHADKQKHEAAKAAWENKRKAAFKEDNSSVIEALLSQAGDEPKYIQPCHMFSEPSFQGIERAFAEGRYTMGLFSDEGGKFLGGYAMKQENQTNTITGLSKLWDGDALDRLRVGDGKSPALTMLYGRRFSVHLMLQPVLSGQLFGNSMMSGQGLLSRCLCCWPESTIGTRPYKAVDMAKDEAVKVYNAVMKDILEKPLPMHDREEMGLSPRALTLTAPTKAIWIGFHDHVEASMKPGGELFPITGFASKTAEHAARIAGVLTAFQNPDATEIGTDSMQAGIAIAQYYLGEALRLFHTSNDDLLLTLADECFRYGMEKTGGVIGLRDLYQYGPNPVRSKAKALQVIQILEEHNRALKIEDGAAISGNHNRDAWRLVSLGV